MKLKFLSILAAVEVRGHLCPFQNERFSCEAKCKVEYAACHEDCNSMDCALTCGYEAIDCVVNCPCNSKEGIETTVSPFANLTADPSIECPDGECIPLPSVCKNPQLTNPNYMRCMDFATVDFTNCVQGCSANSTCYDNCCTGFDKEIEDCPCNANCEDGCGILKDDSRPPCTGSYTCDYSLTLDNVRIENDDSEAFLSPFKFRGSFYALNDDAEKSRYKYTNGVRTAATSIRVTTGALDKVRTAILKDKLYYFGGETGKIIGELDGCSVHEHNTATLLFRVTDWSTIYTFNDEVYLCFGLYAKSSSYWRRRYDDYQTGDECQIFDGETGLVNFACSSPFLHRIHLHYMGVMGENRGKLYAIGGYSANVEFYNITRWSELEGVSYNNHNSVSISTPNGIYMAAGNTISRFDNDEIVTMGHIHHYVQQFLMLDNDMFTVYPGKQLERIFIDGDKLKAFEYDVIPDHKIAVAAKYVNCH